MLKICYHSWGGHIQYGNRSVVTNDIMLGEVFILAKNNTQKKDKDNYRPWRKQSTSCLGCGKGLKIPDENLCPECIIKVEQGYDIW